jgi:hypothetical protein
MSYPTEKMSGESYRKFRADAKLVSETEWMRVYETCPEVVARIENSSRGLFFLQRVKRRDPWKETSGVAVRELAWKLSPEARRAKRNGVEREPVRW